MKKYIIHNVSLLHRKYIFVRAHKTEFNLGSNCSTCWFQFKFLSITSPKNVVFCSLVVFLINWLSTDSGIDKYEEQRAIAPPVHHCSVVRVCDASLSYYWRLTSPFRYPITHQAKNSVSETAIPPPPLFWLAAFVLYTYLFSKNFEWYWIIECDTQSIAWKIISFCMVDTQYCNIQYFIVYGKTVFEKSVFTQLIIKQ